MNGIHAALEGRISQRELRYTAAGQAVLQFSMVAFDGKAKPDAEPEWVRVSVWGQLAEQMNTTLEKGVEVYAEGRIRLNKWNDRDGQQKAGLALSAWTCQPLGQIGHKALRRPQPAEDGTDQHSSEQIPF